MQAGVEVRNTFVFLWPNTNLQNFYDLIIISCETSKKVRKSFAPISVLICYTKQLTHHNGMKSFLKS